MNDKILGIDTKACVNGITKEDVEDIKKIDGIKNIQNEHTLRILNLQGQYGTLNNRVTNLENESGGDIEQTISIPSGHPGSWWYFADADFTYEHYINYSFVFNTMDESGIYNTINVDVKGDFNEYGIAISTFNNIQKIKSISSLIKSDGEIDFIASSNFGESDNKIKFFIKLTDKIEGIKLVKHINSKVDVESRINNENFLLNEYFIIPERVEKGMIVPNTNLIDECVISCAYRRIGILSLIDLITIINNQSYYLDITEECEYLCYYNTEDKKIRINQEFKKQYLMRDTCVSIYDNILFPFLINYESTPSEKIYITLNGTDYILYTTNSTYNLYNAIIENFQDGDEYNKVFFVFMKNPSIKG